MEVLKKYKVILWDFDGVIMDSMPIRDLGFREVLKDFPQEQIDELIVYHQLNGGLSRYVKFRYFFETIRGEDITEEAVQKYAKLFSEVMLSLLINENLLIQDSVQFIRDNYQKYMMHIVSGSDGNELNFICKELGLDQYFLTIHGSPTPKKKLVEKVLTNNAYLKGETVLIGDSINDLEAAEHNGINFLGYNNTKLDSNFYISSFTSQI